MKAILVGLTVLLASCACFKPETRNNPECAILNQIVDCTESAVMALAPQFLPIIKQLLAEATGAGGQIDWTRVEKALISIGIKDGGCILAELAKDFLTPPGPNPQAEPPEVMAMKKSFNENYTTFRQKKWPGIKFKVKKADGTTMVL